MDKLQQLANFCTKNGEAITFFDGKVTLSQVIMVVAALIVVSFAIKLLKGALKTIVVIGAICFALVYYGVASPTQLKDAAEVIAQQGVQAYEKLADASENIKIQGNSVKVRIDGSWVDVADVSSIIKTADGVATVIVDGTSHVVDDSGVISLLNSFK